MVCCAVLALLSKQAAYCLPFLVFGFISFKDRKIRRSVLRAAGVQFVVCAAMFLYRFWIIRGIGGYRTSGGGAAILKLNVRKIVWQSEQSYLVTFGGLLFVTYQARDMGFLFE
jgi:hypothetical protein